MYTYFSKLFHSSLNLFWANGEFVLEVLVCPINYPLPQISPKTLSISNGDLWRWSVKADELLRSRSSAAFFIFCLKFSFLRKICRCYRMLSIYIILVDNIVILYKLYIQCYIEIYVLLYTYNEGNKYSN